MNEFPNIKGGVTIGILEDTFDDCKAAILEILVVEGLLTKEDADEWCRFHTIVARNRSGEHFRSFTSKDYGVGHPDDKGCGDGHRVRISVVSSRPWKSEEAKRKIRKREG